VGRGTWGCWRSGEKLQGVKPVLAVREDEVILTCGGGG